MSHERLEHFTQNNANVRDFVGERFNFEIDRINNVYVLSISGWK